MIIDNVRLPDSIEKGAKGGPSFNTIVNQTEGGRDSTVSLWSNPRYLYSVAYGIRDKIDFQEVVDFFIGRRGRAYGFRFKDWSDFEAVDESLGTPDGVLTVFKLRKTIDDAIRPYVRFITRPVAGTVLIYKNAVLQATPANYTINHETGNVTFAVAPLITDVITASFEFDVPVRFDVDNIDIVLEWVELGEISSLNIVEVRE